jgi:hypothetical protein
MKAKRNSLIERHAVSQSRQSCFGCVTVVSSLTISYVSQAPC